MKHEKNIVLIGFMGCGKSTISREFAKAYAYEILDTDAFIEKQNKMKISQIFERKGEAFFRDEEAKLALNLKHYKRHIIATGGGFYKVLQKDEKNQFVVYLRAEFEFLKNRLSQNALNLRPLFKDEKKAKALFDERVSEYEKKADCIIDIKGKNKQSIVAEIYKELK